jgi:hypothetical protein
LHSHTTPSSGGGTFAISGAETLARFRHESARFLDRGAYHHIAVTLPVAGRAHFESRINAQYRECGCFASAISVLLTIAALIVWQAVYSSDSALGWKSIAADAGIVLLAGALTKVLRITYAHRALQRTLRDLAAAVNAHAAKGEINDSLS